MPSLAKTIQIFLPDGNARSVRIAEITSRTVQAVQVPRSKLGEAKARHEIQRVGVYFLFGESEAYARPLAYIGEAENCFDRLMQHSASTSGKDFWTSAVAVTSKTRSFTKAHAKYLEWLCHDEAMTSGRYRLENGATPAKPYLPEPSIADLTDNFDTIRVLLSTLGFPVLETTGGGISKAHTERSPAPATPPQEALTPKAPVPAPPEAAAPLEDAQPEEPNPEDEILVCRQRKGGGDARGRYLPDGLHVLEGSRARMEPVKSFPASSNQRRQQLISEGILVPDGDVLRFTRDYVFGTPSAAADIVLGRSANGWKEWKTEEGRTLKQLLAP
jgi:hypothetical protein